MKKQPPDKILPITEISWDEEVFPRKSLPEQQTADLLEKNQRLRKHVAESDRVASRLRESEMRIRFIMENIVDGIITIDEDGIVESMNPAAERIFGYSSSEVVGKNVSLLMPEPHAGKHDEYIENFLKTGHAKIIGIGREVEGLKKDGTVFPMDLSVSGIVFGERKLFTGILRDITQRKVHEKAVAQDHFDLERLVRERTDELRNANEKLEVFAKTDPLTGLPNRRGMKEKIDYERIRFQRSKKTFSFLLADIDNFKEINDTYGHEAGDQILIQVAAVFKKNSREQDIVCRWGGEEFVALLPETDLEGGRVLAEKFRSRIERKRFHYRKKNIPVTLSFGVSVYKEDDQEISECIERADVCLYQAKQTGKNRVVAHPHEVLRESELTVT